MEQNRTLDEVHQLLEYAKLEPDDIKPMTQCISFSHKLDNDALKLMELSAEMLDTIKAGDRLVLRGAPGDSAVVCTADKTFELKEAEISNSLLLLPELTFPDQMTQEHESIESREVISILHDYLELRPSKPRLQRLRELLAECLYKGRIEEGQQSGKKYTYEDLHGLVQASNKELEDALAKLQACHFRGHWRLIDFEHIQAVLTSIVSLCLERDWSVNSVPLEETCQTFEDDGTYERPIVKHVLDCYGTVTETHGHMETDEGPSVTYKLTEDKVCRMYAELLLRDTTKFNYEEFTKAWNECIPDVMKADPYQLQGLALIEQDSSPQVITYFPVDKLPEDLNDRFHQLFTKQEKWTLEEITPYIMDVTTHKMNVKGLLMKFARGSMQNGVKVFNSRKPLS